MNPRKSLGWRPCSAQGVLSGVAGACAQLAHGADAGNRLAQPVGAHQRIYGKFDSKGDLAGTPPTTAAAVSGSFGGLHAALRWDLDEIAMYIRGLGLAGVRQPYGNCNRDSDGDGLPGALEDAAWDSSVDSGETETSSCHNGTSTVNPAIVLTPLR